MTPRISKGASKAIDSRLDDLFDMLKIKLLGPQSVSRRLYVGFTHELSLPGLFEKAVSEEGGKLDTTLVDHLIEITADFIDKNRADAKAQVKKRVQDLITDLDQGRFKRKEFENKLEEELGDIWGDVTANVARVVMTQTQHAQTLGIKSGLDQINANLGIDDPTVVFIPVKDHLLCDECKRLHLLEDHVTPRAWLSSEVKAGYHKKGDPEPSWSLLHPHCRCSLATVLPGFGFSGAGRVIWIGEGHDEWSHQRGEKSRFKKSEEVYLEVLEKSTRKGLATYKLLKGLYEQNGRSYEPAIENRWMRSDDAGSFRFSADSAVYGVLTHPNFVDYYESLPLDEQSDLADKMGDHYRNSFKPAFFYEPGYGAVPHANLIPFLDYAHPKHPTGKIGDSKGFGTLEELQKVLKDYGISAWDYRRRDTDEFIPGKHRDEIDALFDKIVPGWREYRQEDHTEPNKALIDSIKNADLAINIPSHYLDRITNDGRWKNLFETGHGQGNTDTDLRAERENKGLGIPRNTDDFMRPVYGWMDIGASLLGRHHSYSGVTQYGDIVVRLKPHVKKRSTVTVGDSFGAKREHVFLAHKHYKQIAKRIFESSLQGARWNAAAERGAVVNLPGKIRDLLTYNGELTYANPDHGYVEAQIHGGVYPRTDVASVHLTNISGWKGARKERALAFGKKFKVPVYNETAEGPELLYHPDTELSKNWKGAVTGLALGAAAMIPSKIAPPVPMEEQTQSFDVRQGGMADMPTPELDKHLKAISFLETSGGKFLNHHPDKRGEYWTAHGPLGFKPAVAHEFYNKHKGLQQAFPGLKDPKSFTANFKAFPQLYNAVANAYWRDLVIKTKDPGLAAFKWRNGMYANSIGWRNHEYVRRFNDLFMPVNERVAEQDTKVPWLDDLKLSERDVSWLAD